MTSSEDLVDTEDVLHDVYPHTKAKHEILRAYLNAWFPILGRYGGRILYLDGFAGSGEYKDHSYGSPIIAVETAKNHKFLNQFAKEIVFFFVELNPARYQHLVELLDKLYKSSGDETYKELPKGYSIDVRNGEFNSVFGEEVKKLEDENLNLAPTMAFVDPFGYAAINLELLGRILRFEKCELLITYMTRFMDRFVSDAKSREIIKRTLRITDSALDEIQNCENADERDIMWLRLLNEGVIREATSLGVPSERIYHLYFKMRNEKNVPLYYLVYFTKSAKGIDAMKKAMWKVGKDGKYTFSDYNFDPQQTSILDYSDEAFWIAEASDNTHLHFKGQTVLVNTVENHVTLNTPWYWRKDILNKLEHQNRIRFLAPRLKRFTYPDEGLVLFL